jgi:hypothetical protein
VRQLLVRLAVFDGDAGRGDIAQVDVGNHQRRRLAPARFGLIDTFDVRLHIEPQQELARRDPYARQRRGIAADANLHHTRDLAWPLARRRLERRCSRRRQQQKRRRQGHQHALHGRPNAESRSLAWRP